MNKKEYKKTYEANKANANYTHLIRFESAIIFILCILLTLICLLPFVIVVVNATRDHGQISRSVSLIPSTHLIENIKELSTPEMKRTFDAFVGYKNSAIITISATILSVFFSALTAYGLCVYDFKLKDAATTFILAVLMVPTQVSGVGFIKFMLAIDLYNNFLPLIIPAIAAPATVFYMRQYIRSAFPLEIVEAARIDGCGELRTFVTIGLPMIKPAIGVQAIFTFIANWNNFYTPSMIITSYQKMTLPMMIKKLSSDRLATDYGKIYCGIAISVVPLIIAYCCLSKYIVAGVALGGVKE